MLFSTKKSSPRQSHSTELLNIRNRYTMQTVQQTNDDAALSKWSAVKKGYLRDPFINRFVRRGVARPPLMNRGMSITRSVKSIYNSLRTRADKNRNLYKNILGRQFCARISTKTRWFSKANCESRCRFRYEILFTQVQGMFYSFYNLFCIQRLLWLAPLYHG